MANKQVKKDSYKTKECKVLNYISIRKMLIIDFDGFGISFITDNVNSDTIKVKYIGKIGTKDFKCQLVR
jgi:hypothetical protein